MKCKKNKWSLKNLKNMVDGRADSPFEYFMLFVILVNIISLGLETSARLAQYKNVFFIIDKVCLVIFIFELVLKFIAFNKDFFKYGWNIFDLVIVLVSILSSVAYLSVFRSIKIFRSVKIIKALKAIRAFKSMKLVTGLEHLQNILKAIVFSIPGIIWTFVILLIFFYIYAIVGVNIFSEEFPEFFGSIGKTFYTLFQLMIFDDYGTITRSVMACHHWAWAYFVSFAVIAAFIVMNVIVGIVVDSIENIRVQKIMEEKGIEEINLEKISSQIQALQDQIDRLEKTLGEKK